MEYIDRSMIARQDGHPTGAICPKCGKLLYYASRLQVHDRTHEEVEYCSGGCGHVEAPQVRAMLAPRDEE